MTTLEPRPGGLVIVDVETTGLDYRRHEPWEFAGMRLNPGRIHEYETFLPLADPTLADPVALDIGGFDTRYPLGDLPWSGRPAAEEIAALTDGCVMIGANPAFDDRMLTRYLQRHGIEPGWHYRSVCVEALAVGWLLGRSELLTTDAVRLPWRPHDVSRALGVNPDDFERHTAMGDVHWAAAQLATVFGVAKVEDLHLPSILRALP